MVCPHAETVELKQNFDSGWMGGMNIYEVLQETTPNALKISQ